MLLRKLTNGRNIARKEDSKQAGANKGESMLMRPQSLFSLSVAYVKNIGNVKSTSLHVAAVADVRFPRPLFVQE